MKRMVSVMGALLIGAMLTATELSDRSLTIELLKMKMAQCELVRALVSEPAPTDRFSMFGKNELMLRPRSGGGTSVTVTPQQLIMRLQLVSEKMVIDPAVGIPDSMYAAGDAVAPKSSASTQKPDLNRMRLQMGIIADKLIIDPAVGLPESFYADTEPTVRPEQNTGQQMSSDPRRESMKRGSLDRVANRWEEGGNDNAQYQNGAQQGPKGGTARDDMGRGRIAPSQKAGAMDELMRDLRSRSMRGNAEQPSPYDDLN